MTGLAIVLGHFEISCSLDLVAVKRRIYKILATPKATAHSMPGPRLQLLDSSALSYPFVLEHLTARYLKARWA